MNTANEKKVIQTLEEMRDLLKDIRGMLKGQSTFDENPTVSLKLSKPASFIPSGWDDFFKEKETKKHYFIVALAVYYLTNGNSDKIVEKKVLESFLSEEVSDMNGRNVGQDIRHAVGDYGYISSAGHGKYKINAVTRKIVSQLPDEDSLKNLSKKYHRGGRKKYAKKKTEK